MRLHVAGLNPLQQEIVTSPARYRLVVAGRRWGKTTVAAVAALLAAGERLEVGWFAPTYMQAEVGWERLRRITDPIPGRTVELSRRTIRLPGGGHIRAYSTHDPDRIRARGFDLAVLDEAAYMPERVWTDVVRPALADRQGSALLITTPNGTNWLHRLWQDADTDRRWARWQQPTWTNPRIPQDEIDQLRNSLPTLTFQQEIAAEFVAAEGARFKPEWLTYYRTITTSSADSDEPTVYIVAGDHRWPLHQLPTQITVDPAASTRSSADRTAIAVTAWTPEGHLIVLDMIAARLEGPDIIPTIRRVADRWHTSAIWIEATAFQLTLIQEAIRIGLPARKLKADRDKISRSIPLEALAEHGRLLLPQHATWLHDLERELLAFPLGEHDDQVDALAYAAATRRSSQGWWAI